MGAEKGAVKRCQPRCRTDSGSSTGDSSVRPRERGLKPERGGAALIKRNPCRIDGGGKEESAEREVVSLPVVFAVAAAVPVRYRALVLLATFGSLRWASWSGSGARTWI